MNVQKYQRDNEEKFTSDLGSGKMLMMVACTHNCMDNCTYPDREVCEHRHSIMASVAGKNK